MLFLAGCGAGSTPPAAPTSPANALPASTVGAGLQPTADVGSPPRVEAGVPTPTPDPNLDNAELVVFRYYQALGVQQYAAARTLLAPEVQARTSEADLEESVAGTDAVGLVAIIPQSITPTRVIFQGIVSARTIPDVPSQWSYAANTRYVECTRTPEGWRIVQISPDPIPVNS